MREKWRLVEKAAMTDLKEAFESAKERRKKRRAKRRSLKPKLKSRKFYVRELDKAFSEKIRAMSPHCHWCGKPTQCCAHILSRTNYATRWDFDNARPSDFGCNVKMEHDAVFISQVVFKHKLEIGEEKFAAMVERFHTPTKFSRHDLASMLEKMKAPL